MPSDDLFRRKRKRPRDRTLPRLNSSQRNPQSHNNRESTLPPASLSSSPTRFPEFPQRLRPLRGSRLRSTSTRLQGDRPESLERFPSEGLSARSRWEARINNASSLSVAPKTPPSSVISSPSFSYLLLLYGVRCLIFGIGLSAIAGTLIATVDSERQLAPPRAAMAPEREEAFDPLAAKLSVPLGREITPLKAKIEAIARQNSRYDLGVFLLDLDTKDYVNWQGTQQFSAASTIKAPILIAFFQEVDGGRANLNETLVMDEGSIVGEAGRMQYQPPGSKFSAKETVEKMIITSDNTATNMIIKRLGGLEALNQRFSEWGLTSTIVKAILPDVEGTNLTSAVDLANVLVMVNEGQLVSLGSRDRLLGIMSQVENRQLLPQGLEPGAKIAHKTGNIGSLIADAGLIDTQTGRRYVAVVMVERDYNDLDARAVIQQISRAAYQYFNQPTPNPHTTIIPMEDSETVAANGYRSTAIGNRHFNEQ